jgi:hypothetical protein
MTESGDKNLKVLSGGVLVVGSLLWEGSVIRNAWRQHNINLKERQSVLAPIRYGRISSSRNCTYTMVFSDECKAKEKMGNAVFIPFAINPIDFKQLETQAKDLINAEFNKTKNLKTFDWDWGALGILFNPKSEDETSSKCLVVSSFCDEWAKRYSKDFEPDNFRVDTETCIISQKGNLLIDWLNLPDSIDFIIATVIKPELKNYPSPKNIADRILVNEYDTYFRENRREGITTFQDFEVEELLSK